MEEVPYIFIVLLPINVQNSTEQVYHLYVRRCWWEISIHVFAQYLGGATEETFDMS